MKKGFILLLFSFVLATFNVNAQAARQDYLAALDTLTNADSHRDTVTVSGTKHNLGFQVDVLKISGTVAGSIKVYYSVSGGQFGTAALDSTTLADGSGSYIFKWPYNPGSKYIVVTATTGTSSASVRQSVMWRRNPN